MLVLLSVQFSQQQNNNKNSLIQLVLVNRRWIRICHSAVLSSSKICWLALALKKTVIKEWSWHYLHNWLDSKSRITSWHALLCPVERPCEEPRCWWCYGERTKHAKCLDVDGDDFVMSSRKNMWRVQVLMVMAVLLMERPCKESRR